MRVFSFIESTNMFLAAISSTIKNTTSHCGRFQFQCHSGDCIAVYNACDGIPQCDDGSDEGPEVSKKKTIHMICEVM